MNKAYDYTPIKTLMSRMYMHPILSKVPLETVLRYVTDFLNIVGLNNFYLDKQEELVLDNYRVLLPTDLIRVNGVKNKKNGISMRSMTAIFDPSKCDAGDCTYKIQGSVLYSSKKEGPIIISYKSLPTDDSELPMIPDVPIFLEALELYIKIQVFTIQFDLGKIGMNQLAMAKQDYAWKIGQLNSEFTIPDVSEMQSITNEWNQMIPRTREFNNGFRDLGTEEVIRR